MTAMLRRRALLPAMLLAAANGRAMAQGSVPGVVPGTPRGAPPSLAALGAQTNAGTVGIIAGGIDGTYARIAADLAAVLDEPSGSRDALRVLPILGKGSLQNLQDILVLRGVDIGIVQSDALAFARRERLLPGLDQLIQYIAKLYDEEVHVLAGPGIERMADLAGRTVNVDVRGSGTAMTASLLLDALGVTAQLAHDPQDLALEKLRRGEIAALVYVAGKPARLFSGLPAELGLRFLPVPMNDALFETYLPSRLVHADYPNLVPGGAPVEIVAVGAVLAVYAWAPGTERHRKVARFMEAFFARFDVFQQPPRHPKWREVNLAAQVPGWTRFNPNVPPPRGFRRRGEGPATAEN